MPKFDELQKLKQCPLCDRKWHILEEKGKTGKCYFFCNYCMIILWVRDMFLNKWDEFDPVPCAVCGNTPMKFFCREDGYCKWYCPKCKATIENYDPDIHGKALELKDIQKKKLEGK